MHWTRLLAFATVIGTYVEAASSFDQITSEPRFTFSYQTTEPNPRNWIGIYKESGGGPVNQAYVESALVWAYTPEAKGTVYIPTSNLTVGRYKAFFLANDKYRWLADPLTIAIPEPAGTIALDTSKPTWTFKYTTNTPNVTNWIGIYPVSGGPMAQVQVDPSLVWGHAPGASGTLFLSPSKLKAGDYKAFFLAQDGYKWLTGPITITARATDIATTSAPSASASTTRSTSSDPSPTASPTSQPNAIAEQNAGNAPSSSSIRSSRKKKGLGAGAIAGIAIGAVAFLVIAILVVFFKRRRSRAKADTAAGPHVAEVGTQNGVAGTNWNQPVQKVPEPKPAPVEIDSAPRRAELAG